MFGVGHLFYTKIGTTNILPNRFPCLLKDTLGMWVNYGNRILPLNDLNQQ